MVLLSRITLKSREIWFEAFRQDGVYRLRWPEAGWASLSKQGRLLRFEQHPDAKAVSIKILRRIVKAYSESLQGKDALHATALEKNGKAIALIGPCGEGKSTLAAYLLKNDPSIRLLGDDLLSMKMIRGQAWLDLDQEAPRLKLSREIALRFGFDGTQGCATEFDPNLEKEIILFPFRDGDCRPIPLVAIFQIQRGRHRLRLERVKGAKAVLTLMANIYNELLRPPKVLANQFEFCTTLSRLVSVWRLGFPSGFKRLPAVAERIEGIWSL